MKFIELKVKKEGEESSTAWVTLGKYHPYIGKHRGLYLEFCIPLWKMTKENYNFNGETYGWYGRSFSLGYYILLTGRIIPVFRQYLRLLKTISCKTREAIDDVANTGMPKPIKVICKEDVKKNDCLALDVELPYVKKCTLGESEAIALKDQKSGETLDLRISPIFRSQYHRRTIKDGDNIFWLNEKGEKTFIGKAVVYKGGWSLRIGKLGPFDGVPVNIPITVNKTQENN